MKSLFFLLSLVTTFSLFAQPGTLDNTFGTGGKVIENISAPDVSVIDIVAQPDSKLIVLAKAKYNHRQTVVLLRYNTNGTLDNTFDGDGIVASPIGPADYTDEPTAIQLQADGKILICGNTYGDISVAFAIRYNTNGGRDASFGTNGVVYIQDPGITDLTDLSVLPTGEIVLLTTSSDPFQQLTLVKLNTDGSRATSFGTNGVIRITVNNDYEPDYKKLAVQADGKFVIGGTPYRSNGPDQTNFVIVRVNAAGTIDATFGINGFIELEAGPAETDLFNDMILQPDGKIVGTGVGYNYNRQAYTYAIRIGTSGSVDNLFGSNGFQYINTSTTGFASYGKTNLQANGVFVGKTSLQADGKLLIAGFSRNAQGNDNIAVARLTISGMLDAGFDGDGIALLQVNNHNSFGIAPVQQTDGSIMLAGIAGNGTAFSATIGKLTATGQTDNTINAGSTAITYLGSNNDFDAGVNAFIQPDQKIINIRKRGNGYTQDVTVTRHLPNGTLDNTFGTLGKTYIDLSGTYTASYAGLLSNGKFMVVCNLQDYVKGEQVVLLRFGANGNIDSTFGTNGKLFLNTLSTENSESNVTDAKLLPSGKTVLLINQIVNLSLPDTAYLIRLNADGSFDTSFNGNGKLALDDTLQFIKIHVPADDKVVAVYRGKYGAQPNMPAVIRYNANGTVDASFNGGNAVATGVEEPLQLTMQPDGKVIVAGAYNKISRLNSNGSFDSTFDGDGTAEPGYNFNNSTDIKLQPDGKILLGGNTYSPYLAYDSLTFQAICLKTNGTLDSSFGTNGIAWINVLPDNQNNAQSLVLQDDGKIIMSGYSTYSYTYNTDFAMIRLNGNLASITYTFSGSGSWTVASNWTNGIIPPATLPAGSSIIIDPPAAGICYLNTVQHISAGASLTVKAGKQLVVIGNLNLQ